MANKEMDQIRGVAQYAGFVDQILHVGDNDYGRSGDWVDVAVHGGIIRCPLISPVNVDDQVIIRGIMRNRGRVLDFVTQSILTCTTDEQLAQWEKSLKGSYRGRLEMLIGTYEKTTIVNKSISRYTSHFKTIGLQFSCPIDEEQYLSLTPFNKQILDFHFDLVRDFRVTSSEGSRNTVDTWMLLNPVVLSANRSKAGRQSPASAAAEK